ncbi:MAG TPA: protein kinase [Candidatus Sulfotelmatobacter sp.]|jgi:serine/threonine protein kinase/tetratricopeptide (TPR) repeat protein|nr:protein kinase [Candidatus Sulfotelmatobacter sp.]
MNDPKQRSIDSEAATLVPDSERLNGSPVSENNSLQSSAARPAEGQDSDAPTMLEGVLPPIAPVTGQHPTPDRGRDSPAPPASAFSSPVIPSGTVIGRRYEILKILGEGGMGAVYKAKDLELNRVIALKVIKPELARNPEILQRFKQELILARQVTDRNVIRIFDLGEAGGIKFITMEYVEGQSLYQLLREQGKLPVPEAVDIMRQTLSGLLAAHREGVIHRDLKPGNIMRDSNGRVVVMDFGLARSLAGDGMTRTGTMMGTMEYMSPEQAQAKDLDARSDIFTVGLICYELLTGKMPYHADSVVASLLRRMQERAAPPSDWDATIPQPVSELVTKCLERNPADRWQSAQEIVDRIDEIQGKRPMSVITSRPPVSMDAAPVSLPQATVPPVAFKKRLVMIAIAAGIVAMSAIAGWLLKSRHQTAQVHQNVRVLLADFRNATSDSVFDGTVEPTVALQLEGAPFISVFNRAQARSMLAELKPGTAQLDEANARLVAVREGVDLVVSGEVTAAGSGYKILSKVTDALTGKTVATEEADASNKSNILRAVANLADQMRTALGDTASESAKLAEAETFTTASLEATHEYAEAQEARYAGKTAEAIKGFRRAVELDPNFGSAYGNLGALYWNDGNQADAINYFKLAMQHIDRMTDREKYRTRGGYYLAVADGDKAVEEFSALVKQYPADSMGLSALAHAYYLRHDMAKAVDASRRAVEIYPRNVVYRTNASLYALFAGDYDTSEREAKAVLAINPAYEDAFTILALCETAKGNFDQATEHWRKVESLSAGGASSASGGLADLALYRSAPEQAISELQKGIDGDVVAKNTDAAAKKYVTMAEAQLMAGKKADALKLVKQGLAMSKANVMFAAARVYIMAGDLAQAGALGAELSKQLEFTPQAFGKLIDGDIQLSRGNARQAVQLFRESERLSDSWLAHFDLARAYIAAEAYTDATTELETCLRRRGEATDIYIDEQQTFRYFPATYYYLGRAMEGLKSAQAADAYKSFLAMKVSSAHDPMVDDAKKRLAKM